MAEAGTLTLVLVALGAFWLAGFAQSVTGFGSALIAIPILTFVVGPVDAVVAMTMLSVVLSGWAAFRERAHVDGPIARRMSIAGILGMPFGLLLLSVASDGVLQVMMAVTVLVALVLVAARVRAPDSRLFGWATGAFSGALLTSTGMNGPPLVLSVSAQNPEPQRFRGTLQVVFCVHDIAAVVGFVAVSQVRPTALIAAGVGVLAAPLGWLVGDRVFHRIPARIFHRVLSAGLVLAALALLVNQLR